MDWNDKRPNPSPIIILHDRELSGSRISRREIMKQAVHYFETGLVDADQYLHCSYCRSYRLPPTSSLDRSIAVFLRLTLSASVMTMRMTGPLVSLS